MKIAVLWTHFSGYLSACLRALAARPGIELFVSFQSNSKEAPYADSTSSWISRRYIYDETPGYRLLELLQEFQAGRNVGDFLACQPLSSGLPAIFSLLARMLHGQPMAWHRKAAFRRAGLAVGARASL